MYYDMIVATDMRGLVQKAFSAPHGSCIHKGDLVADSSGYIYEVIGTKNYVKSGNEDELLIAHILKQTLPFPKVCRAYSEYAVRGWEGEEDAEAD